MRSLSLAIIASVAAGSFAHAQDASSAIKGVISQQLDALEQDDFAGAFEFASPMIRHMFQTPDVFGQMVRQGYPMVWKFSEYRFLETQTENGRPSQRVMITDPSGAIHILQYDMIRIGDAWRIDGVRVLTAAAPSA